MASKKAIAGTAGVAAIAVTATLMSNGTKQIEGTYSIIQENPYCSVLNIDVPGEFTPDIVTLKLNDVEISKTLLPQGKITTVPIIFSDLDRLSLEMYVRGNEAATATLEDNGKLVMTVKDKYIKGAANVEE